MSRSGILALVAAAVVTIVGAGGMVAFAQAPGVVPLGDVVVVGPATGPSPTPSPTPTPDPSGTPTPGPSGTPVVVDPQAPVEPFDDHGGLRDDDADDDSGGSGSSGSGGGSDDD